jgi:predicted patatin/cPLA2 family phospholipase
VKLTTNVPNCALVFEGGGYRAGYTAGMALALLEEGIYFPFVCGLSAGASNTVNYLSRDMWRARWSFTQLASLPQAGGTMSALRGDGYFNGDYCYRGVIDDGTAPFDWETFVANPARMRIQSFERDTGRTVSWGTDDFGTVYDLIDRVRASSTLPWLMNPIEVDGQVMLDGGLGEGAGIPLRLAELEGYDKFLFLSTRPAGYRKSPHSGPMRQLVLRLTADYPHLREAVLSRAERYNAEMERVEELERAGRCLIVRPERMDVESTTYDLHKLEESFDQGHAQALRELPRWREFLFGSATAGPRTRPTPTHPVVGTATHVTLEPRLDPSRTD